MSPWVVIVYELRKSFGCVCVWVVDTTELKLFVCAPENEILATSGLEYVDLASRE